MERFKRGLASLGLKKASDGLNDGEELMAEPKLRRGFGGFEDSEGYFPEIDEYRHEKRGESPAKKGLKRLKYRGFCWGKYARMRF